MVKTTIPYLTAALGFLGLLTVVLLSAGAAGTALVAAATSVAGSALLVYHLWRGVDGNPPHQKPEDPTPAVPAQKAKTAHTEGYAPGDDGELDNIRVLIAGSDRGDRHGIEAHLSSWGARVEVAGNAVRAFHRLIDGLERQRPFHVVIVDQGRLDMSSSQFAVSLRSDPQLQYLKMVLVGNIHLGETIGQLKGVGFASVLPTPLDKTLLFNAIHGVCMDPPEDSSVVKLSDHYISRSRQPPLSILLADVDLGEKQRMQSALKRMGHQVFVVDDGARVLDALDGHRFDLAITSLQLRKVTGLEVFKLYRFSRVDGPSIPFIVLLDDPRTQDIQACEEAGVEGILTKPFESRRLRETIDRVIQENASDERALGVALTPIPDKRSSVVVINAITLDSRRLEDLENLSRNAQFLPGLIENFRVDTGQQLEQMKQAIAERDIKRFCNLAHAIKDGAGSLGALEMYQLSIRATRCEPESFTDVASELVHELDQCSRSTYTALCRYLNSFSARNLQD